MARILSIDYGKKRTGIAVTDPMQIVAGGLVTVCTSELLDYIDNYIKKEQVEKIVVGEPKQTNGIPSENMERVVGFIKQLKALHPEIPIELYDERFTSSIAHKAMIEGGLHKKARQNKALVDKISATIILEDYLESIRNKEKR
ncbi:MAG: Holliday junction resolvase RuvX [Prevotella sp.]|nr:Holliday junction resolvase RuvX [Prevotella sp.]